ncbi:Zinc-finger homeodomain protein 3 [Cardamine amara subsp. amara]|uniref:Zinc-finger homeodomain protein 3 n=1 Tax=Cardamine amara subsp. amara TaxID=228776 RepID=A0ABD1C824_CARAN
METANHQEDHDMPIPINTSYGNSGGGHGHMIHHLHHHPRANSAPSSTTSNPLTVSSNCNGLGKNHHHHMGYNIKKDNPVVIKYKECLKNHAASMGGNAIDGCGEFMPSGEEGSIEALTCSACKCHRNFHRREIEGEEKTFFAPYLNHHQSPPPQRKLMFHHKMIKSPLPQQMIMPIGFATAGSNSESEDLMEEDGGGSLTYRQPPAPPPLPPPYRYGHNQKKRFRTKFTPEQKEKMLSFAERVGWKIQRQEESVVQEFCQEVGIRRRVLKVWMHNNKHMNLSKKITNNVDNNVELSAGTNATTS